MEIIVASVLFSIGSMAVLTMTFSALQAYAASRDQTIASDIAARVASMIKMEAKVGPTVLNNGAQGLYVNAPIGNGTSLSQALFAAGPMWGNNWVLLTAAPVDERMTTLGATRYCVFMRGGQMPSAVAADNGLPGAQATNNGITLQAQIAVVYPAANGAFADPTSCAASVMPLTVLDPASTDTGNAAVALDALGLRVVYTGVLATVRRFN
jgi:hypothetical protein